MTTAQSQALAKRSADTALMPPPPAPKRQKRPAHVLEEDVFHAGLSHIIRRDFFPGLEENEAQLDYLDAMESKDPDLLRSAARRLTHIMTPRPDGRRRSGIGTSFTPFRTSVASQTPRGYAGSTPMRTPTDYGSASEEQRKPKVDLDLSLGAFVTKYTSEDNESFNALLDKDNAEQAERHAFYYQGNQIPSARQIAHRAREQKVLESRSGLSTSLITVNAAGEARRVIAADRPSEDLDARPASVEGFRSKQGPRNSLMFEPDGVEEYQSIVVRQAESTSNAPLRAIDTAATRFPTAVAESDSVPPSPSISAIDAAIAGRPKPTSSESDYAGAETPRVNGYAFVDAEPTPSELGEPITDEEADRIEQEAATKLLPSLDPSGPNPFNITNPSKREEIHMRLVEEADASRRKGSQLETLRRLGITSGRTPTPRFTSGANIRKSTALTPAAQKLAERLGTPCRESRVPQFGTRGDAGWTPTPRRRPMP